MISLRHIRMELRWGRWQLSRRRHDEAAGLFYNGGLSLTTLAVREAGKEEGIDLLRTQIRKTNFLQNFVTANRGLEADIEAGKAGSADVGGRHPYLVLAHLATLVDDFATAEEIARLATRPWLHGTRFWDAYAIVFECFLTGQPQSGSLPKATGGEKYWLPYVEFMLAASAGEDLEAVRSVVQSSFEKRNRDKRISPDAFEIEGCGFHPATWDFRAASLEKIVARRAR